MSSGTNSLGYIWKKRGLQRIVFLTYAFDFYWFHNFVLPRIKRVSDKNAEVLILASKIEGNDRSDVIGGWGDQYHLKEWMQWGTLFKVVYLPSRPIFHAKIAAIFYPDSLTIGIGSANLTPGGWNSNLESWCWNQKKQATNLVALFDELVERKVVDKLQVQKIREELSKQRVPNSMPWLYGPNKKDNARKILAKLVDSVDVPSTLRVISPYFDGGSMSLLKDLISSLPRTLKKEFWIDRSGVHAQAKDYGFLEQICSEHDNCEIKTVKQNTGQVIKVESNKPIHAKIIELEDLNGTGARIFGSANFTSAAWLGSNIESVVFETYSRGENFVECLGEENKKRIQDISIDEIKSEPEKEKVSDDRTISAPIIYWAIYSEEIQAATAHLFLPKDISIVSCAVEPSHHPQRDLDSSADGVKELKLLKEIETEFNDASWDFIFDEAGILTLTAKTPIRTPEMLRLSIVLSNGRTLIHPVLPAPPRFDDRDFETGIPKHISSVIDLLNDTCPIVRPIQPTNIIDNEEEDDEFEDQEIGQIIPELSSLSESPEYNHLPEAIKIVKRLKKIGVCGERKVSLLRQLRKFIAVNKVPQQGFLARALLEALDE